MELHWNSSIIHEDVSNVHRFSNMEIVLAMCRIANLEISEPSLGILEKSSVGIFSTVKVFKVLSIINFSWLLPKTLFFGYDVESVKILDITQLDVECVFSMS